MFVQSIDVDFFGIDLRKQLSVLEMVADIDDEISKEYLQKL